MTARDLHDNPDRTLENDYFRKRDMELLKNMRRQAEREAEIQAAGKAFALQDRQLIEELLELGFSQKSFGLLPLVPLVQVAWADGSLSKKERETIALIASLRGIHVSEESYGLLQEWLNQRPHERFFRTCTQALRQILRTSPTLESDNLRRDLSSYCICVASASGGAFGLATISREERMLLTQLARDLELNHPEASRQTLAQLE